MYIVTTAGPGINCPVMVGASYQTNTYEAAWNMAKWLIEGYLGFVPPDQSTGGNIWFNKDQTRIVQILIPAEPGDCFDE